MLETCKFVLSLDIGGANTKVSFMCLDMATYKQESDLNQLERYKNILKFSHSLFYNTLYFPFWERKKKDFRILLNKIRVQTEKEVLNYVVQQYPDAQSVELLNNGYIYQKKRQKFTKAKKKVNESVEIAYDITITITAELSDAFATKKEGIEVICQQLKGIFNENFIHVITVNSQFVTISEALKDYLSVSASNWIASSLVFGERERMGILLDMGTTTLDIIPIKDGQPVTIGKNDVDRLLNYELFYTGILRPPIASIVRHVPFRNTLCTISFEEFAIMADVYLIMGLISEQDYSCDTPDGRGKSLTESYARLARVICGDTNMITRDEINAIAEYVYNAHKEMVQDVIRRSINQFVRRFVIPISKIRFNVTGLGANILLIPVLKQLNINENQIFHKTLSKQEHLLSTAICLGIVFLKQEVQKYLVKTQVL